MSKRIGQCMEPRSVGNVKYYCVEPAGHQCEHRYVPSIDDVERLAARVRELEAERDALRRDAERYRWLKANARRIDFAGLSWSGGELDGRIDAALGRGEG